MDTALAALLLTTLAIATVTDLDRRLIPNRLLAASSAACVAVVAAFEPQQLMGRGAAAALAGGLLLAAALASPSGMGMGDVKLAGTMGLYLGAAVAPALLLALVLGAAFGLGIVVREGSRARRRPIPFAPFLAAGGAAGLAAGEDLIRWYLSGLATG